MHEIADGKAGHLGHHMRQQRIRCDIEWHAEEDIGAPLIELAAQLSLGDVELE